MESNTMTESTDVEVGIEDDFTFERKHEAGRKISRAGSIKNMVYQNLRRVVFPQESFDLTNKGVEFLSAKWLDSIDCVREICHILELGKLDICAIFKALNWPCNGIDECRGTMKTILMDRSHPLYEEAMVAYEIVKEHDKDKYVVAVEFV